MSAPSDAYPLQPLTVVLNQDSGLMFRIAAAVFPPVGSTIDIPEGNKATVRAVRLSYGEEGFYVSVVVDVIP